MPRRKLMALVAAAFLNAAKSFFRSLFQERKGWHCLLSCIPILWSCNSLLGKTTGCRSFCINKYSFVTKELIFIRFISTIICN